MTSAEAAMSLTSMVSVVVTSCVYNQSNFDKIMFCELAKNWLASHGLWGLDNLLPSQQENTNGVESLLSQLIAHNLSLKIEGDGNPSTPQAPAPTKSAEAELDALVDAVQADRETRRGYKINSTEIQLIKKLKQQRNMSASAIGRLLSINERTVSKYLKG